MALGAGAGLNTGFGAGSRCKIITVRGHCAPVATARPIYGARAPWGRRERYHVVMGAGLEGAVSGSVPTLAVLIGILVNNSRLNDLRAQMTDLRAHMDQRLTAVDQRIGDLKELFDEKLKRVEDVMDARLTRIEQELKIR